MVIGTQIAERPEAEGSQSSALALVADPAARRGLIVWTALKKMSRD